MQVSGFTFVRNAVKFGYPITQSIMSILPIVDEFVVCVGDSEDDTLGLIKSIGSPKIRIVHSVWDDSLRQGGRILAVETDKAFAAVSPGSDWCFYLQGDELVHEKYLDNIQKAMRQYKDDPSVEGLLFKYEHFYGSYRYVGDSRKWYSREVRIIRNDKRIHSYKDAQGFRIEDRKLRVKLIDAYIYHYGWVKAPQEHQKKLSYFPTLWHDEGWMASWKKKLESSGDQFLQHDIDSLSAFKGTHPKVMQELVAKEDWVFDFDTSKKNFKKPKDRLLYWIEKQTGKRSFEYRNYELV